MKTILFCFCCFSTAAFCSLTRPWMQPYLASNHEGQAVATWGAWETDHVTLYRAEFTPDDGWEVNPLNIDSQLLTFFPVPSINDSGTEAIAWTALTGAQNIAEMGIFSFGSATATTGINSSSLPGYSYLQTLPFINETDNTALLSQTYSTQGWCSLFTQDGSSPIPILPPSFLTFVSHALFFAQDNSILNVLTISSPTCSSIYLGGPVSDPTSYPLQLISPTNTHAVHPSVTTDPLQQNATIIWQESPTGLFGIGIYSLAATGTTSYQSLTSSTPLNEPRISCNGNNQMVWVAQNVNDILFSMGTAGTWTNPQPLPAPVLTGAALIPQVAINASGQIAVAWIQTIENIPTIYAQLYSPTGGWTGPSPLSSSDYTCAHPSLYLDDTGCATVIWQATQGATQSIQAATLPDFLHDWDPYETLYTQ